MNSQLDLLTIQDQEAVQNTYYRYPKITPHINLYKNYVEVKTIDNVVNINKIDEVILYIVARFKWVPAWLAQQWFEALNIANGYNQIEKWIKVGLVWAQTGSTGVFIRPTYLLFTLLEIKDTNYAEIPFNLLNHTCAEMQIIFDVMMGNPKSEIWQFIKDSTCLPTYHPFNITTDNDTGVPIFTEDEYRGSV